MAEFEVTQRTPFLHRLLDIIEAELRSHFDKVLIAFIFIYLFSAVCGMILMVGSFSEASVQWARELTIGILGLLSGLVGGTLLANKVGSTSTKTEISVETKKE
jgi:hypothetical protein